MNPLRTLKRIGVGALIGTFCATLSPAHIGLPGLSLVYAARPHSRVHTTCSLASLPQAGIAPVVSSNLSLTAVQSNISLNTTDLGTGYINCYDNAYWVGMQANVSSGCGGVGEFAQDGWVAVYNGSQPVTYQYFTEYYNAAAVSGCGDHELYLGTAAGGTYEVTYQYSTCNNNGPGALIYFYANGSLINSACSDWNSGNAQLDVSTEIQGSTNHAGAIGFWWTKYCLSAGCTPGTAPSGATPSTHGLSEVYIGNHGVTSTNWPNWNTCDVNDFNSTTC